LNSLSAAEDHRRARRLLHSSPPPSFSGQRYGVAGAINTTNGAGVSAMFPSAPAAGATSTTGAVGATEAARGGGYQGRGGACIGSSKVRMGRQAATLVPALARQVGPVGPVGQGGQGGPVGHWARRVPAFISRIRAARAALPTRAGQSVLWGPRGPQGSMRQVGQVGQMGGRESTRGFADSTACRPAGLVWRPSFSPSSLSSPRVDPARRRISRRRPAVRTTEAGGGGGGVVP
jgi:hypothetical protein